MIKNKAILHHSKKLTINRPDKSTLIKKQNDNINLEKNIKIRIQEESNSYKILSNNKIDKFTLLTLQKSNNDDKQQKSLSQFSHLKLPQLQDSIQSRNYSLNKLSNRRQSTYFNPLIDKKISSSRQDKINELLIQFIHILKVNQIIAQTTDQNLIIKNHQLCNLVVSLISLSTNNKLNNYLLSQKFQRIKYTTKKIINTLNQDQKQNESKRLKIISNIFQQSYSSNKYGEEIINIQNKLNTLHQNMVDRQVQLSSLKQSQIILSQEYEFKQKQLHKIEEQLSIVSYKFKHIQNQYDKISKLLKNAEHRYTHINQKSQQILNYVSNQQKNKIIKLISQDYKDIEESIYQYAVYLQSNQLANSYTYQPRPFQQIEKQLMEQMKQINRSIIQQENISIIQKQKLMRNFILQAIDKFKKKDNQLGKLNQFKTKCIRQFIDKMKKWLNNWQLKQQYLVNLRKDFIMNTEILNEYIQQNKIKQTDQTHHLNEILNIIQEKILKIQENYKLGNSFY